MFLEKITFVCSAALNEDNNADVKLCRIALYVKV